MGAGLRYVAMSPNILKVLLRSFLFGLTSVAVLALLPLVARHLVQGGPLVYGALLGAFGVGAVGGAFIGNRLRDAALQRGHRARGLRRLRLLRRGARRSAPAPGSAAVGMLQRRRLLGAGAGALQHHRPALDPALGGRPGALALSDRGLRRHGAGQLALGQRRRALRAGAGAHHRRGRDAGRGRRRAAAAAARPRRSRPRSAQLDRAAGRVGSETAERADLDPDRLSDRRAGHPGVPRRHGRAPAHAACATAPGTGRCCATWRIRCSGRRATRPRPGSSTSGTTGGAPRPTPPSATTSASCTAAPSSRGSTAASSARPAGTPTSR